MKTFKELVAETAKQIIELMPWDLEEKLKQDNPPMLLDIREPSEFQQMRIQGSINVPRGILESSCDYDYIETIPKLVHAREDEIILICRSGNRSVLAANTMQEMGYKKVASLKTGLKGWNDFDQPLVNENNKKVNADYAENFLNPTVKPEQLSPKKMK